MWPAQSLDGNIIENIWDDRSKAVMKDRPMLRQTLITSVFRAWGDIRPARAMPASHCPEMVARWLHETSIYFMFNFVFTSPEFSRIWVKCTMIARSSRRNHGEHGHNKELVRSQYGYIDFLKKIHA